MPRTTPAEVGGVIDVDYEDDLTPFITAANTLINRVVANDDLDYYDEDDPVDAAHLRVVETWLAAHFYSVLRPRNQYEQAGSVQEGHFGKVDLHLNVTHHGQQAIILDTSGALAALNASIDSKGVSGNVGALWLGTPIED